MATKTKWVGNCPKHGEFYMDVPDSPCPSCEDEQISEICCDVCGRQLAYDETVAVIGGGIVTPVYEGDDTGDRPSYVDEGEIQEVLCKSCDAAMTLFLHCLQKRRKDGPAVVEDIDKLLDTIAKHVDILIE